MNNSTFVEFDEPEFRKPSSKNQLAGLTAIRIELTKVSNNTKQLTYFEMRQIRLKYKKCLYPSPNSTAERLEVKAINKLLKSFKSSHPEICSKNSFLLSQQHHAAKDETTDESSFSNATQLGDLSKNLMTSFVERSKAAAQESKEAVNTHAVMTIEDLQQLDEKERFELCMRWAVELQQTLAEHYDK